jgi:hypothetical protein
MIHARRLDVQTISDLWVVRRIASAVAIYELNAWNFPNKCTYIGSSSMELEIIIEIGFDKRHIAGTT